MGEAEKKSVLFVSHDPVSLRSYAQTIEIGTPAGTEVAAVTFAQAPEAIQGRRFDVIMVNAAHRHPDFADNPVPPVVELVGSLHEAYPQTPIIVINAESEQCQDCQEAGATLAYSSLGATWLRDIQEMLAAAPAPAPVQPGADLLARGAREGHVGDVVVAGGVVQR